MISFEMEWSVFLDRRAPSSLPLWVVSVRLSLSSLLTWRTASVILWILCGSPLINNILGVCLTISAISMIRLPSLKIVFTIFILLFLYDIFWVFFSERFFHQNVMVTVAQQNLTESATRGFSFRIVSSSDAIRRSQRERHLSPGVSRFLCPLVSCSRSWWFARGTAVPSVTLDSAISSFPAFSSPLSFPSSTILSMCVEMRISRMECCWCCFCSV